MRVVRFLHRPQTAILFFLTNTKPTWRLMWLQQSTFDFIHFSKYFYTSTVLKKRIYLAFNKALFTTWESSAVQAPEEVPFSRSCVTVGVRPIISQSNVLLSDIAYGWWCTIRTEKSAFRSTHLHSPWQFEINVIVESLSGINQHCRGNNWNLQENARGFILQIVFMADIKIDRIK